MLMFAALIRTRLSGRARNLNTREKKLCILRLYKIKHRMTCSRGLLTVRDSLGLFVRSGIIDEVFTTDENE